MNLFCTSIKEAKCWSKYPIGVSIILKLRISRKEEAEKRNNFARPPRRQPMKGIVTLTIDKSRKWRRSVLDFCRRHFQKFSIFYMIQDTLKLVNVAKRQFNVNFTYSQYLVSRKKSFDSIITKIISIRRRLRILRVYLNIAYC